MPSRRQFVKGASLLGLGGINWSGIVKNINSGSKTTSSSIDWKSVKNLFPISNWEKMYLNSGSAGVLPIPISDYLIELTKYLSTKAPYEVWNEWQDVKKSNIQRLSRIINSGEEEVQIVRNTTEALNMIINGLPLKAGDEVILAEHDYGFAINAWENRAIRDGIILKKLDLPLPGTKDDIVQAYAEAIGPKTKVVHVTHITHRLGLRMPSKEIVALAHANGAEVVVDGAHVIGQTNINLRDIDCDYFASSLHKWLNAPLGTGLLFVKEEKIKTLYNHPSSYLSATESINKFEHLGTRAWQNEIGIAAALDFNDHLSIDIKEARLQYLKEYWCNKASKLEKVSVLTPIDAASSAAIAVCTMTGLGNGQLKKRLNEEYNIHVKTVSSTWGSGLRISPNIFLLEEDLDYFVESLEEIAKD